MKKRKKRRVPAFLRQKNENRLGMTAAVFAIVVMVIAVGSNSMSLKDKEKLYAAREQELMELIEQENQRRAELEEFQTYTKTKKYAEEIAKDKLGLVYENEVIFQEIE